jgi:hypothetical protein
VHAWWRLDQPVTDADAWHERMKAIAGALGSDQSVCDWPRIMRLPGFVNWKHEQRPTAVLKDCDPTRVYPMSRFGRQAAQSIVVKPKSMSELTRRFCEEGYVMTAGRRQTMFTVACDLAARGWGVAEATELPKKKVQEVLTALRAHAIRHLCDKGSGEFSVPELGVKLRTVKKKAIKAGERKDPFTGEMRKMPARPASVSVRASALKALKDAAAG